MNRRGVALILSYVVVAMMTLLGSTFLFRSIAESNITRKYVDSVQAFWTAEAGLADAFVNYRTGPAGQWSGIPLADGNYQIDIIDEPLGRWRELRATANYGNSQKVISGLLKRVSFPFENTVSAGGDINLTGALAIVKVFDKTRITGTYNQSGFGASGWFQDKQEGISSSFTTLVIPDKNNNGIPDEFADFVLFGQEVIGSYPAEQVVYIVTDDTVNIFPDTELIGKKVVFVEGSAAGTGDVNIFFDATWQEDEDLTIISTGTITYVQPLQFQEEARLSAASWVDYNEASIFRSEHESVIYAHQDVNFVDILDWGTTTGNVIANGDISLLEILTNEEYYYSPRAADGDLPPGFLSLSDGTGNLTNNLTDWQEQ